MKVFAFDVEIGSSCIRATFDFKYSRYGQIYILIGSCIYITMLNRNSINGFSLKWFSW